MHLIHYRIISYAFCSYLFEKNSISRKKPSSDTESKPAASMESSWLSRCSAWFVVDRFLIDVNHLLVAVLEATGSASDGQQAVWCPVDRQSLARVQATFADRLLRDLNDLTFDGLDERVVVLEIRKHHPHSPADNNTPAYVHNFD